MNNPLFQTGNDTPNNSTTPHAEVTETKVKTNVDKSFYKLDHVVFDTLRYGEYKPFICTPVVPKDEVQLRSVLDIRSDTIASPMLTGISVNQDYVYVSLAAICPRTFDYLMKTPAFGDDVPDDAFPSIALSSLDSFLSSFIAYFNKLAPIKTQLEYMRLFALAQHLFSPGSLLNSLGYSFPVAIHRISLEPDLTLPYVDIDTAFDDYNLRLAAAIQDGSKFTIINQNKPTDIITYTYKTSTGITSSNYQFSSAIEFIKAIYKHIIDGDLSDITLQGTLPPFDFTLSSDVQGGTPSTPEDIVELSYDSLTLFPIFAYHSFVSQFCSNTAVDKIYNFELWQANMRNLGEQVIGANGGTLPEVYFTYNGTHVLYDYLSGKYYSSYLTNCFSLLTSSKTSSQKKPAYDFLFNLLSLQPALLYGDRFANARVRSLGIEDDASIVLGTNADAVDVTRSVIYQKFKNKVSKLRNSLSAYLGGFFGIEVPPDYHYPVYIGGSSSAVSGFEIDNTTSLEKGEQVTRLNSKSSDYAFRTDITFHGYILGIASFSAPYAYSKPFARDLFFGTRWEMYNPDFQHLGDDVIRNPELYGYGTRTLVNTPFAYENRDEFYKVPMSRARGAFNSSLRSWAFVIDQNNEVTPNYRHPYNFLCPEFLRCNPASFDRFYLNFSNSSLSNWYHFIVKFNNELSINRNMIKSPNITLG